MLSNQQVTDEMIEAGLEAWNRTAGTRADMIRNAYTAMQSAQPLPTDDDDTVERVARAIAKRRGSPVVQHFHRADARAAIHTLIGRE